MRHCRRDGGRDLFNLSRIPLTPLLKQWAHAALKRAELIDGVLNTIKLPSHATDIAAAFRRMEIRTLLRDMKPEQQTQYFAKYGDSLPIEIAQALIELPADFSGIPQSRHDLLTERALDAQFEDAIGEIKEIEQAIEVAMSSVEAARDEVRIEAGIHDVAKFNQLAAPIEHRNSAPWLRRWPDENGEEVRVIDLEARTARLATPEEIATGIFAETIEQFNERIAA